MTQNMSSPRHVLGLDEAGCGPGFGELVASAVYILEGVTLEGITDSKKLSEKKRSVFFDSITKNCLFGIGIVTNVEIDTNGLGEARRVVFERALDDFTTKYPDFKISNLIVDGTIFRSWKDIPYECIPKADSLYPEVSAASVIAKVTRDRSVLALCEQNPYLNEHYNISKNKGYLTAEHIQGIKTYGKSQYHRHSYKISGV